tara:strand:- start:4361 stop:6313 length:1953 start_codon:yes stop_codon:yes gene_type:complete
MNRRFSLFDSVRGGTAESKPPPAPDATLSDEPAASGHDENKAPALAEDRDLLGLALATNTDPAWIMDSTGRMTMKNDAFAALSPQMAEGLKILAEDLLGENDEDLYDLADGEGTLNLLRRSDGDLTIFSARFDRPAPQPVPPVVPVRQAAASGNLSPARQFDAVDLAWARYDETTNLIDANQTFCNMFGLSEEFVAARPRYFKLLEHFRSTRQIEEQVDFRAFRDRELAVFQPGAVPEDQKLYLPDGRVLRRLVVDGGDGGRCFLFEDQTARLDLQTSLNAVAAVQQKTLDNLFEGAVLFGEDGRVLLTNARLREAWPDFGTLLEDGDLPPHIDDFLHSLQAGMGGADDHEALRQLLLSCLSERRDGRLRLNFTDGRSFDALAVPLPDGAILLSLLDVTSDVQMQAALEDRAEAFAAADRLKSEFIANVSHEVRTPLTALQGFAEILRGGMFGKLQGRQVDYVDAILRSGRELTSLVDDILDLAIVEAGQADLEISRVDIHALVVGVLNRTRGLADRRRIALNFDVMPDIGWLKVDERRMQQALYNLVCNALALTPPGGRVSITAWRDEGGDGSLVLAVGDTGLGLQGRSPEDLFGSFTGPREGAGGAGDSPATGLGMTIVRKFVELHGGSVIVRDRDRQGLMVECRLPG